MSFLEKIVDVLDAPFGWMSIARKLRLLNAAGGLLLFGGILLFLLPAPRRNAEIPDFHSPESPLAAEIVLNHTPDARLVTLDIAADFTLPERRADAFRWPLPLLSLRQHSRALDLGVDDAGRLVLARSRAEPPEYRFTPCEDPFTRLPFDPLPPGTTFRASIFQTKEGAAVVCNGVRWEGAESQFAFDPQEALYVMHSSFYPVESGVKVRNFTLNAVQRNPLLDCFRTTATATGALLLLWAFLWRRKMRAG